MAERRLAELERAAEVTSAELAATRDESAALRDELKKS